MGMDVSGKNPSSEVGEYFRASVWSWRLIHALMVLANNMVDEPVVPQDTWEKMHCNDGEGLQTQEDCNRLADAFESLTKNNQAIRDFGLIISAKDDEVKISFPIREEGDMVVDVRNGSFVSDENRYKVPVECLVSPYSVYLSHLKEFISFLRACGGFEVW